MFITYIMYNEYNFILNKKPKIQLTAKNTYDAYSRLTM